MELGALISLAFRAVLLWLTNKYDPRNIKLREIVAIKDLRKEHADEVEKAIVARDTAALSEILKNL